MSQPLFSHFLFISVVSLTLLFTAGGCDQENGTSNARSRPNVLFILADDLGYGELGSYGQEHFDTPNIDALAEAGLRFTSFYAGNTVCAPSRASLITGKHPGHSPVRGNFSVVDGKRRRVGLGETDVTTGELFKEAGYRTASIGKWHLFNSSLEDSTISFPQYRGFDVSLRERFDSIAYDYYENVELRKGIKRYPGFPFVMWENGEKVFYEENFSGRNLYIDDILSERSVEFIKDNKNNPFYLHISYKIPHVPEELSDTSSKYIERKWPSVERVHALRIEKMDRLVGSIIDFLKENDKYKNTLIIFTSDNGGHSQDGHSYKFFDSNAHFRGGKGDLYEGGIRVPMIAVWEGRIEEGTVASTPAAFWDFVPTFADILGLQSEIRTDGTSLLPVFENRRKLDREYLYWEYHSGGTGLKRAVRKGDWKAVDPAVDEEIELYNLDDDPQESDDISGANLDIVRQMEEIMNQASVRDSVWY